MNAEQPAHQRDEPWLVRRSGESKPDRAATDPAHSTGSGHAASRGFNNTTVDSHYQRDRARIIHCASFRSLQSKTQVLGLGESDFYRTRLTHSLEVAQIGSGVAEWLKDRTDDAEAASWIPTFSLIEAVCLAHDIGHSPFGHGGEVAMNYLMLEDGGFEANGQTLRILARLGEYSENCGLDLTRRTQLGTIKYPACYSTVANYAAPPTARAAGSQDTLNIDAWSPPKCIYDDEQDVLDWILEPFSASDRQRFLTLQTRDGAHHRTTAMSLDTSIMELADDIAYGVHDLEDALALGLINQSHWEQQVAEKLVLWPDNDITRQLDFYNRTLFSGEHKSRKHAISKLVGYFIRNISLRTDTDYEHPLLRLQASMESEAYEILLLLKNFVMQDVILRPELQALQYKGQQVIIRLFDVFASNPERLLPTDVHSAWIESGRRRRVIADYIAGMTDVSAGRLYHKLHSPTAGSIFDRT